VLVRTGSNSEVPALRRHHHRVRASVTARGGYWIGNRLRLWPRCRCV